MPDVLIVIDQQKAKRHTKWGPRNNPQAEANIARLLAAWRQHGWPLIHVRHDSTLPDSPFRPGQEGNDFEPLTAPRDGETVLPKRVTSAFIGTDLEARLEALGRPSLVMCGWLLANSVEATVRSVPISASGSGCPATPAGRAIRAISPAGCGRPRMCISSPWRC
jgi:nicotinamidase-related amidase